jgi:uncharacterized membrane protein YbhN (UPF0104 family)
MMTIAIGAKNTVAPSSTAFSAALASRPLKIAVAVILLGAVYWAADWKAVLQAAATLEPTLLIAALAMFLPQTLVSAVRWRMLIRPLCRLAVADAVLQTLAASALNLVTPSKLGDLSKAAMMPLGGIARRSAAVLALVEKAADVIMLVVLCGLGWLGWGNDVFAVALSMMAGFTLLTSTAAPRLGRWLSLGSWTLLLWLLHLTQIGLFLWSAGVDADWGDVLARVPLAIFAGLVPVSFCGLGTRDAALIYLFSDIAPPSTMAVVGLLTGLRYLVPGALGIPLVSRAFRHLRSDDAAPG